MHRHRIKLYAAVAILFFIEVTVLDKIRIFGVKPDMLLIMTAFFGLHFGITSGMETGIVSGVLKDIFSITNFGINTFSFLLIGFLSGCLKDKLFKESVATQFLFSCFSVYLASGIYFLYLKPLPVEAILYKGLYTGTFAPFLFYGLAKIFKLGEGA